MIAHRTSGTLTVTGLSVAYHGKTALENISFKAHAGTVTGIFGPNGAGKSTLMKAVLGLTPYDAEQVLFAGNAIAQVRSHVAYVPQRKDIDADFPINVLDTVLLGCYPGLGLFRRPRRQHREWALECLDDVGMAAVASRHIGELSGGQQQRVFLARALAQQASFLFLDEPYEGIDAVSAETITSVLAKLKAAGNTILVVHHDLTKAADYFDQLLLLNRVLIASGTAHDVLNRDVLAEAYGPIVSLVEQAGT